MAGPFQQIKDFVKMQQEAKKMQKKMKDLIVYGESKNREVIVQMNGLNEILDIQIEDFLLSVDKKGELIRHLQRAMDSAKSALQREMAKDFDINDLKNMLNR